MSLNTESVQRGMRGRGHRREGIISLSVSQGGRDNASGVCTGALKGVRGGGETSRGVGAGPGGGRGRGEPQGRSRPTPKGGRRRQERRPRCRRLEAFVRGEGRRQDRGAAAEELSVRHRRVQSSTSHEEGGAEGLRLGSVEEVSGRCVGRGGDCGRPSSASTGTVSFAILSASSQASSSASYGLGPTGSRERTECRPKASDAPAAGGRAVEGAGRGCG